MRKGLMGFNILLADDEEDLKTVLKVYLQSQGHKVHTAYDGLDALDQVKSVMPDLVLLDIMMPLVDGFEVCRKLKADETTAHIPVIMLSAASHAESIKKGIECGAAEYLVKPFEPSELEATIQKVVKAAN